ncbi:unnamed protein product, partial [Oppiella nova]
MRILVTHQIQFIRKATQILVLSSEGRCLGLGSYDELQFQGIDFMAILIDVEQEAEHDKQERELMRPFSVNSYDAEQNPTPNETLLTESINDRVRRHSRSTSVAQTENLEVSDIMGDEEDYSHEPRIQEENREVGSIGGHIYYEYFTAGAGPILFTITLLSTLISQAMVVYSVYSPIMVDMKYILNTTMKWVSLFITFETSGYIVGTFELWRGTKFPIVQIHSVSFGIGSVLCTQALKPYLVGEVDNESKNETMVFDNELRINENDVIDRRSRLMFPIFLIGACIIIIPISLFIMYCLKPYKMPKEKDEDESHENQTTNDGNNNDNNDKVIDFSEKLFNAKDTPRAWIGLLFALTFSLYAIYEAVFMKFAVTYYQYSPLRLSAQSATNIYSTSIAIYSAGLVMNIFYPYKFQLKTILSAHIMLVFTGTVFLIPGRYSMVCLWVASICTCLGFSAMYAGIVAFTELHMGFTNKLSATFRLLKGLFTLVTPFIVGNYIEDYSVIFIIMEFVYLSLFITL